MIFNAARLRRLQSDSEDENDLSSRNIPRTPEEVSYSSCMMTMMKVIAFESQSDFMGVYPHVLGMNFDDETFHVLKKEIQGAKKLLEKEHQKEKERHTPWQHEEHNPYKNIEEEVKEKKKRISMESEDDLLVDVAVQWLNMLSASQKKRVTSAIKIKEEPAEEGKKGSSSKEIKEELKSPYVPPPDAAKEEEGR